MVAPQIWAIIGGLIVIRLVAKRIGLSQKSLRETFEAAQEQLNELVDRGGELVEKGGELIEAVEKLTENDDLSLPQTVAAARQVHDAYEALPKRLQDMADNFLEIKALLDTTLQKAVVIEGWRLLDQKVNKRSKKKLAEHVQHYYEGLFLIGCAGKPLKVKDQERFATDLQQFHNHLGRPEDVALVAWYQVVGAGKKVPLSRLLQSSPEVHALGVDPRYIALAMGETVDVPKIDILAVLEDKVAEKKAA